MLTTTMHEAGKPKRTYTGFVRGVPPTRGRCILVVACVKGEEETDLWTVEYAPQEDAENCTGMKELRRYYEVEHPEYDGRMELRKYVSII